LRLKFSNVSSVSRSYAIEQWEEKEKAAGSEVREYAYKERARQA
jgi:hypothetical protein